ncbi:Structure-specific endonuclease subunit SLX1 [Carex littledalei]|uniref:Structure-specific endonuclease subunit SLX1 homolog n=1 Tax=Carex littledalei TaxID=544730 RepID=A0A833RAY4_9POAL|nr:Structure-specific endonuclease subunit SLX1 [Carex littledalei]
MGRRRKEIDENEENEEERERNEDQDGFFACYLLCSLCPRHKSRTYIGFTVNPRRRIRQHNGEIQCGAWRTKKGRPWEMVLCIYGFPSNITALQFEWAWQHPTESLAVRKAASNFKSLGGLSNKIKLAYTMLNLPSWENLNLTVNFFSTKYTKFSAGCPKLPNQMKFSICAMDELPIKTKGCSSSNRNDETYEQAQQPDFDSMEEVFSSEKFKFELELEKNYERCQELESGSTDGVENQNKEEDMVESDEISSPKRFNEAISSNTGDGIPSQDNNVIDLVTPLSCAVRLGKRRGKKIISSTIDLTISPCVIEL